MEGKHTLINTGLAASATKPPRISWANGSALFICAIIVPVLVWRDVAQNRRLCQLEYKVNDLEKALHRQQQQYNRPAPNNAVHNEAELDEAEVRSSLETDHMYETGPLLQKILASIVSSDEYGETEDTGILFRNANKEEDVIGLDKVSEFGTVVRTKRDSMDEAEEYSGMRKDRVKRGKNRGKKKEGKKKGKSRQGLSTTAAHFVGDRPNGGVVQLEDGIVNFWKFADWMTSEEKKKFSMNLQGEITVEEEGLYYIYSQVTYQDEHNLFVGHSVNVGQKKFLSCKFFESTYPYHSCFTAGITLIKPHETVSLILPEGGQSSGIAMEEGANFLGLLKISNGVSGRK